MKPCPSIKRQIDRSVLPSFSQRSIGDVLSEQGRYEEALEPLQAASQGLQVHEQYKDRAAWALSSYASALDKLGKLEEALATYAEAITLLPESPPLLRNRAETLIRARRLEQAEADLARTVELDGNENSTYLWYRRAQLTIARGDGMQAHQMLDEVAQRDAAFDVRLLQAQSAWLQGDLQVAQQALQNALEQANPGDRVAIRHDMQLLFDEHSGLAGRDELQEIMVRHEK